MNSIWIMIVKCVKKLWIVFIVYLCADQRLAFGNVSSTKTSQKVFKTGENMKLSCSSKVRGNLTWWFSGEPLNKNIVQTSDGTTVLQISNVSRKNQGLYWCGSSWQHVLNVTVLIGDLPSPPRNVKTMSVEFKLSLQWTYAESTGGLPVHYTVTFYSGNTSVPALLDSCGSKKHEAGKHYSCPITNAYLYKPYKATVYAINALGNSSDSISFKRPNILNPSTHPLPPIHLTATEIQQGKVKLSWKYSEDLEVYTKIAYFRIAYKKEKDDSNKTWLSDNNGKDTTVIIDNLDADTTYWFYVMKQYRTESISSPLSAPAAIRLHTKYSAPDQPPQNLKCFAEKANLSDVYTINLSWQPPSKGHGNGPLMIYKITYSTQSGNQSVMTVNASQTHANFTVANLDESVVVYTSVCNKGGFCSGISDSCQIQGLNRPTKIEKTGSDYTWKIILAAVICACILALIFTVLICYRRRDQKNAVVALPEDIDGPYIDRYNQVINGEDEAYDTPLVSNMDHTPCDTAI